MKVTYIEREFIDRYTCIDHTKTRNFLYSWVDGGLTYFEENEYDLFALDNEFILKIEE